MGFDPFRDPFLAGPFLLLAIEARLGALRTASGEGIS